MRQARRSGCCRHNHYADRLSDRFQLSDPHRPVRYGLLDVRHGNLMTGLRLDVDDDQLARLTNRLYASGRSDAFVGTARWFPTWLSAITQHFGQPGTLTDHAWIEGLEGQVKTGYPHLLAIGEPAILRAELAIPEGITTASCCTPVSATSRRTTNTTTETRPPLRPGSRTRTRPATPPCPGPPGAADSTRPEPRRYMPRERQNAS